MDQASRGTQLQRRGIERDRPKKNKKIITKTRKNENTKETLQPFGLSSSTCLSAILLGSELPMQRFALHLSFLFVLLSFFRAFVLVFFFPHMFARSHG
jgi:hypothetical protein